MPSPSFAAITLVLVHGAYADGSCWNKVIPKLESTGAHVIAVQNPLTSLKDDVAATRRAIAQATGPVVLVGHSWGGAVITEAGNDPKVKALVYVAAFAPDSGQSAIESAAARPPSAGAKEAVVDAAGFVSLPPSVMAKDFAQDLPPAETALMAATQGPVAAKAFEEKISVAAWRSKPTWYVIAAQDHMIDPLLQRAWAAKMKAKTVELASSHVPMLSRPSEVTALIEQALESVAK